MRRLLIYSVQSVTRRWDSSVSLCCTFRSETAVRQPVHRRSDSALRGWRTTDRGRRHRRGQSDRLIDPYTIANLHIRIHALKGRLFCSTVEKGAAGPRHLHGLTVFSRLRRVHLLGRRRRERCLVASDYFQKLLHDLGVPCSDIAPLRDVLLHVEQ